MGFFLFCFLLLSQVLVGGAAVAVVAVVFSLLLCFFGVAFSGDGSSFGLVLSLIIFGWGCWGDVELDAFAN